MTDTANLGLPFIDASQAQKHVTHNEALRILDAAIQIAVLDMTRTAPPPAPAEGQRHVVASGATGAWAGQAQAIATWQDGAWAFLAPKPGWTIWSLADQAIKAFDGSLWHDAGALLDNVPKLGVNTAADTTNRLAVGSNAALLAAIDPGGGGSGDVRLQLSKSAAANTASVVFSANYSGRAEFGLIGSDAFKLKVAADGASWVEALAIDPSSGNLALPRGLVLSGVAAPAQLTANQNNYSPAGLSSASVLQISADAARSISGLAGGAEGRVVGVVNVGSQPISLLDEDAASTAANRFSLGGAIAIPGKQAVILRYDGTAARWRLIAGGTAGALTYTAAQALTPTQQAQARANAGVPNRNYLINPSGEINQRGVGSQTDASYDFDRWLVLTQTGAITSSQLIDVESTMPFMMRLLQAQSSAQRFGRIQWLEKNRCRELRGQDVTLSARVRISTSTTLRCAIIEWTGTADSITKDVVNDWASSTYTAGNFFTAASTTIVAAGSIALATNTLTDLTALTGTVSSSMNNLAVLFWTDAAQPQNVTLDIAKVKLEKGSVPSPYIEPDFVDELKICQRYFEKSYDYAATPGAATSIGRWITGSSTVTAATSSFIVPFKCPKRVANALVTIYETTAGNAGKVNQDDGSQINGVINRVSENHFEIAFTNGAGRYSGAFQYKVDAEL